MSGSIVKGTEHLKTKVAIATQSIRLYVGLFLLSFLAWAAIITNLNHREPFLSAWNAFQNSNTSNASIFFKEWARGVVPQSLLFGCAILLMLFALVSWWSSRFVPKKRGSRREDALSLHNPEGLISVACADGRPNIQLPASLENRGHLVIGASGTGKTVLLNYFVNEAKKGFEGSLSGKMILHDYKGDYTSQLLGAKSSIPVQLLSFVDERSVKWNILRDLVTLQVSPEIELYQVAQTLIPPQGTKGEFWEDGARQILIGCMMALLTEHGKNVQNKHLKQLCEAPAKTIYEYVSQVEKARKYVVKLETLAQGKDDSTAMSFYQTFATQILRILPLLEDEGDFTISQFLSSPENQILILGNYPRLKESIKNLLALSIQTIARWILSQQDVDYTKEGRASRSYWLFLDEFCCCGYVPAFEELLTNGRSKGVCNIVSVQDFKTIESTYPKKGFLGTLRNNLNSWWAFRLNEPDDAHMLARGFGKEETTEWTESLSMGENAIRDSLSIQKRVQAQDVVLDSEITTLPDLSFFLKIPNEPITKVPMKYWKMPITGEAYQLRDFSAFFDTRPTTVPQSDDTVPAATPEPMPQPEPIKPTQQEESLRPTADHTAQPEPDAEQCDTEKEKTCDAPLLDSLL